MRTFDGLRGATALRRARAAVRRYPGEVEAVPDRLWLLGANPVGRFTVGAWQTADASIEASLASIDSPGIESGPSAAPSPARTIERDVPSGRRSTVDPATPYERAGGAGSSTRLDAHPFPGPEASRPDVRPRRMTRRGWSSLRAADTDSSERDRRPLPHAGSETTAARSANSWVARSARRGGMTPVRVSHQPGGRYMEASAEPVVSRPESDAFGPGPGSATLPSFEATAGGTTSGSAPERSAVPRSAPSSTRIRDTLTPSGTPSGVVPPRRLAGLARWWDETHAPAKLRDREDSHDSTEPKGPIERMHMVDARSGGVVQNVDGMRSATVLDLRAQFGELLEAALLEGARADGIEVRP